jgi:hypothetical protein
MGMINERGEHEQRRQPRRQRSCRHRNRLWRRCYFPLFRDIWGHSMDHQTPTLTPEPRPFPWTARKLDAARLVAEDFLSDERIAAQVGIDRRQLTRWKSVPQFMAKVEAIVAALGERSLRFAVARRHRRVKAQNDRWRRLKQVIRERAADPQLADVPGGSTGLVLRRLKMIGAGENSQVIEEFEVDTGLLKALLDHEKQVAQEVGQWTEKREVDNKEGAVNITFIEVRLNGPTVDRTNSGTAGAEWEANARPRLQFSPGPDPGVGE